MFRTGVVRCSEGVVYLASLERPTDIGLLADNGRGGAFISSFSSLSF